MPPGSPSAKPTVFQIKEKLQRLKVLSESLLAELKAQPVHKVDSNTQKLQQWTLERSALLNELRALDYDDYATDERSELLASLKCSQALQPELEGLIKTQQSLLKTQLRRNTQHQNTVKAYQHQDPEQYRSRSQDA